MLRWRSRRTSTRQSNRLAESFTCPVRIGGYARASAPVRCSFADVTQEITFEFARVVETRRLYQLQLCGPRPRGAAAQVVWQDSLQLRLAAANQAFRAWNLAKARFFARIRHSVEADLRDFIEDSIDGDKDWDLVPVAEV